MIVMALLNPVAFLLMLALWVVGAMGAERLGYDYTTLNEWVIVAILVATYLIFTWVLPRWTNPWYYLGKISPRKRHELLWGRDSAYEKYGDGSPPETTPTEPPRPIRWPTE